MSSVRLGLLLAITAALAAPAASEQEPVGEAEIAATCRKVLCREPAPIRLAMPKGEKFEMTPDPESDAARTCE